MRTAIVMRHGDAEEASSDYYRPLSALGHEQCLEAGRALNSAGTSLDRVVCSSAPRTQRSAELVAAELGFKGPVEALESLYLANEHHYLEILRACPPSVGTVLMVAHNPGLSILATRWNGTPITLATAGYLIARFDVTNWDEV